MSSYRPVTRNSRLPPGYKVPTLGTRSWRRPSVRHRLWSSIRQNFCRNVNDFLTVLFNTRSVSSRGARASPPFPTRVRVMPRVTTWHYSTRLTEKRLGGRGRRGPSPLIVGPSEVLIDRCQRSESVCWGLSPHITLLTCIHQNCFQC